MDDADEPSAGLDLDAEVASFARLRERAHEQIAALSVTIAQLEALRTEIEQHRQPRTLAETAGEV